MGANLNFTDPSVGAAGPGWAAAINTALANIDAAALVSVRAYGAVGDGVADDTAAFAAASTVAGPTGSLWVAAGTYKVSALPSITTAARSIICAGSGQVTFLHTGSAACLLVQPSSPTEAQAGRLLGCTIDGTSAASASAVGVHVVDTTGFGFDDVVVRNYTGASAVGIEVECSSGTCRGIAGGRVSGANNTVGLQLVGGSATGFAGHTWTGLRLTVGAGQVGIQAAGSAAVVDGSWNVRCDITGTAGIGFDLAGTSKWSGWLVASVTQSAGTAGIGRRVASSASWTASGVYTSTLADSGTLASRLEVHNGLPLDLATLGAASIKATPNVYFPEDYAADGTGGILSAIDAAVAAGHENIVIQLQERPEASPYLVSGALRTDREGNAQIPLPFVSYPANGPAITIQGPVPMDNYFPGSGQKGAIIESTLSGATFSSTNGAPSVIGGPTYQNSLSGGSPRFTYLNVTLKNLAVVVPAAAPIGGVDFDLVGRAELDGVVVFAKRTGFTSDFSDAFSDPSANPHGFGIRMPRAGNYGKSRIGTTGTFGVYAGLITNEHAVVVAHVSKWCKIGWVPSTGTPGHAMTATTIALEWCTRSVSGWSEETGHIDLAQLTEIDALIDIERPPTTGTFAGQWYQPVTIVNDPLDNLAGDLRYYAGDGAYTQVGTSWRLRQQRLRTAGIDVQGRLDHRDFTPTSIPNVTSSTAYALDPANLILNFRAPLSGKLTLYWELFASVDASTNLEVGWLYASGGVSTGVQVFPTMEFASNGGGLYLCTSRRRTKTDWSPGVLYQVMLAVRNTGATGTIAIPNDNIHIEAVAG